MSMFVLMNLSLFGILAATAVTISRLRALYEATMLTALFSLVSASLFVLLDAVDVAFTEAAVGVGISTVLFLGVLALTRSREAVTPRIRRWPARVVVLLVGGMLVYASQDLPRFGGATTPVQVHPVTEVYLQESQDDIGIRNTVTSVLASYRAYDTFGELIVIFTAGVAVLLLLASRPRPGRRAEHEERAELVLADYRVLRVISKLLLPFILLFAFYVLFHGEYGPGGGFQAGVIFASGFVLYGLVFGLEGARRVLPQPLVWVMIPLGILLYLGLGVAGMVLGGEFLDFGGLRPGDPRAGQQLGILLVETSVGITVAAVIAAVFFSFASRGAAR
jgi:multicomponent Na+:H+ antiporter subunit B